MKSDDLKRLRERLKLSQRELAALLDCTIQSVSRWERGAVEISTRTAKALQQIEREHRA